MTSARIRWRNVARLAGGLLVLVGLVALGPALLRTPEPEPLPADVGLETGATGAVTVASGASDRPEHEAGDKQPHGGGEPRSPDGRESEPRSRGGAGRGKGAPDTPTSRSHVPAPATSVEAVVTTASAPPTAPAAPAPPPPPIAPQVGIAEPSSSNANADAPGPAPSPPDPPASTAEQFGFQHRE